MGVKIMGGAFAASVISLFQHGRTSSKYFGEHHSWPSHLQADLAAACWRDTNLEILQHTVHCGRTWLVYAVHLGSGLQD